MFSTMRQRLGKVVLLLAVAGAAMVVTPARPAAAQQITVLLNGRPVYFGGVPPIEVGGRVLVPLRGVFEALNATVDYDSVNRTVLANRGETQVQLTIGSRQASVNGQVQMLDVPAQARLGRTLVPLRFISEALGAQVRWSGAQRTVYITPPPDDTPTTTPPDGPFTQPTPLPTPLPQPTPAPVTPPYTPPANTGNEITGTVERVDANRRPPSITLRVNNQLRIYDIAYNALISQQVTGQLTAGAEPTYRTVSTQAATPTALSTLNTGQEVRLVLDARDQVTQILTLASLLTARVRYAQGNQITLDDAQGTTLNIGGNLRYIDPSGRAATTTTLRPGDTVALYVSPATRRIYQISAAGTDIATADPNYVPPYTPPGYGQPGYGQPGFPPDQIPAGTPEINLVQHNASQALRAQGLITVTVRGTPGMRGSFQVLSGTQELPLTEERNQPGVYRGTYTVRPGDNILNGRITAYLRSNTGEEAFAQSQLPLTIDTAPPVITGTSPTDQATINVARPNIVVYANDIGGSGLVRASVTINGRPLPEDLITVSPNAVSFIPDQPLSGQVQIRVSVADEASNSAARTFNFYVDAGTATGPVTYVTHNATRALQAGENVTVEMSAEPGGRASFDVLGENGGIVSQAIPMTEISRGQYRGYYTVQNNLRDSQLRIRARFVDFDGRATTTEATSPILLVGGTTADQVTIIEPVEGDPVTSPLTIRGRATPYSTVEVSVRAEGTRYFVLPYVNELGTQQVQTDASGRWATTPVDLPQPRNVSNLRYVITAVQVDVAGRRSEPVTTTVTPR